MNSKKQSFLALSSAVALALAASSHVFAADDQQLTQQVQNLQSEVDQLKAQQANQASQPGDVAAAPTIPPPHFSSMFNMGTPLNGGVDPTVGFVFATKDGAFSLNPQLLVDIRNDTAYRESIPPKGGGETGATGYDTQNGFDLTRLRLVFQGNFTSQIYYWFQFQADQGAALSVLDAYASYHFGQSPFSLKVGQFKDPIFHERNLSEATLMAVDRSFLEATLGGGQTGRVQGASLIYDHDDLRGQLVLHDGFNSVNTKFFDAGGLGAGITGGSGVTPTDFGVSTRGEILAICQRKPGLNGFAQYDSGFTSLGAKQNILVLGAGADYSQAGANDVLFHTVDAQFNTVSGWSLYGAVPGNLPRSALQSGRASWLLLRSGIHGPVRLHHRPEI